jgi:hypothetical protein
VCARVQYGREREARRDAKRPTQTTDTPDEREREHKKSESIDETKE